MSSFRTIKELGNAATQIALQLHAIGPVTTAQEHQTHDAMGTATVIAPHLAITCKHVVEDYFRSYRLRDGANEANFLLSATMVMASGHHAFDLVVKAVALSPHTDVAFLHLGGLPEPLPFTEWTLPVMDLFPPRIGSVVHAVGYHSARAEVDHARREIHVHREVAISEGGVIDVHEERRDARLNFPCFQTDARFDGGMSGGPVFNDAGALCGIISSNLPPSADGEPHVSYVATLWPIAGTIIDFGRVDSTRAEPVLALMVDGVIKTQGHEFVIVQKSAEGEVSVATAQGSHVPGCLDRAVFSLRPEGDDELRSRGRVGHDEPHRRRAPSIRRRGLRGRSPRRCRGIAAPTPVVEVPAAASAEPRAGVPRDARVRVRGRGSALSGRRFAVG